MKFFSESTQSTPVGMEKLQLAGGDWKDAGRVDRRGRTSLSSTSHPLENCDIPAESQWAGNITDMKVGQLLADVGRKRPRVNFAEKTALVMGSGNGILPG